MGVRKKKYSGGSRGKNGYGEQSLMTKTTSAKRLRQLEKQARRMVKDELKSELESQGKDPSIIKTDLALLVAKRVSLAVNKHSFLMGLKRTHAASKGVKLTDKNYVPNLAVSDMEKILEEEDKVVELQGELLEGVMENEDEM